MGRSRTCSPRTRRSSTRTSRRWSTASRRRPRERRPRTSSRSTSTPPQRAGMLTDAGFITTRARGRPASASCRAASASRRCSPASKRPGRPTASRRRSIAAGDKIATQTAQEQVAYRAMTVPCNSCHPSFDPYGLVLDWYDAIGRFRTMDDLGKPIDGHTTLPASIGGADGAERRRARRRPVAQRHVHELHGDDDAEVRAARRDGRAAAARSRNRRAARPPGSPTRCGRAASSRSRT